LVSERKDFYEGMVGFLPLSPSALNSFAFSSVFLPGGTPNFEISFAWTGGLSAVPGGGKKTLHQTPRLHFISTAHLCTLRTVNTNCFKS
jgi:hypothetical protein